MKIINNYELLKKLKTFSKYFEYYKVYALRSLLNVFNIFPIKNNQVLFHSFNGRQYSCNPRAISEVLMAQNPNVDIVWAFCNPANFANNLPKSAHIVKMHSLKYYYIAKTSKVIVFNARGKGEIARRRNQIIIQTWHASNGYKNLQVSTGIDKLRNKLACCDYTHVMCGTRHMEDERVRGTMCFSGPIIHGTARMDSIINNDYNATKIKVCNRLSIPSSSRIVLYAPTYRNKYEEDYGLNYDALKKALTKKFGGDWILVVRLHYFVIKNSNTYHPYVDATDYPDMQELMMSADVLVSDYSSCIWDYSFTGCPCFLFCPDLPKYAKTVKFNLPIKKWGFPIAENTDELQKNILEFNLDTFKKKMQQHHIDMGSYEDGKACQRVMDIIQRVIK